MELRPICRPWSLWNPFLVLKFRFNIFCQLNIWKMKIETKIDAPLLTLKSKAFSSTKSNWQIFNPNFPFRPFCNYIEKPAQESSNISHQCCIQVISSFVFDFSQVCRAILAVFSSHWYYFPRTWGRARFFHPTFVLLSALWNPASFVFSTWWKRS